MSDVILMLLVLGAINHQITHIVTTGVILAEVRTWVKQHMGQKVGYLTTCHLCCGTWVGFGIALLSMDAVQLVREPVANFLLLSFANALVGRVWNEGLALASSKVSEIRAREARP
jgi:hypothetical protein